MMKNISLILILLTCVQLSFSQKFTISGTVKDFKSGEPIIGAKVFDLKSKKGTISNEYGFYSITLPKDSVYLRVSYMGFTAMQYQMDGSKNVALNVELNTVQELDEVTVTAQKNIEEQTQMSSFDVSIEKIKALPVFLGEKDIIKTIQLFPGIQSGSEGSSGIYVRGGGQDQNLMLLDGVPIYNATHLFGFFSIFNADAINKVTMIKGGFPARYGGRLSSVLNIRMKEGNMKKFHGEGSIGIISSKLSLEGPIIKDKTSYIISGRRTYIDLLARPFVAMRNRNQGGGKGEEGSSSNQTGGYYFWDLNAKINHKFSETSRLYLSGYFGRDRFYNDGTSEFTTDIDTSTTVQNSSSGLRWGNAIGALRWNKIITPKLFMNVTGTFSQYQFRVGGENQSTTTYNDASSTSQNLIFNYDSGIQDWGGKVDFDYRPNPNHTIKFGLGDTYHTFIPGVNQFQFNSSGNNILDTIFGSQRQYGHEHWVYFEDDWEVSNRLKFNIGVHLSGFKASQEWYPSIQPRFSARYMLTENSSIKASYSSMTQFLHLLTNPTIGLPTDLWVPVTDRVAPEYSNQFALGYAQTLQKGIQFSVEAYYKDMQNLIAYKEGVSFFGSSQDWQDKITVGSGNSYGLEVLVEKKLGKTSGWIGYTLSWSNRQFDSLNFGNQYPYIYDRRHDIGLAVTHKFNEKVDIGVVWVFGSGYATTLAQQTYLGVNSLSIGPSTPYEPIEHIEARNDYRMPAYHRLDIGVNIHKKKKNYESTWSFGLYNAYSRQNAFYLFFEEGNNGTRTLNQLSLFPILPSISYSFKF
jgi:outer membrane cobalamin receptor